MPPDFVLSSPGNIIPRSDVMCQVYFEAFLGFINTLFQTMILGEAVVVNTENLSEVVSCSKYEACPNCLASKQVVFRK